MQKSLKTNKNIKNNETRYRKPLKIHPQIYVKKGWHFYLIFHANWSPKWHQNQCNFHEKSISARQGTAKEIENTRGLMLHVGRVNWLKKGLKTVICDTSRPLNTGGTFVPVS